MHPIIHHVTSHPTYPHCDLLPPCAQPHDGFTSAAVRSAGLIWGLIADQTLLVHSLAPLWGVPQVVRSIACRIPGDRALLTELTFAL